MDLVLAIICFLPLLLAIVKKHPNVGIISILNTISLIFSFGGGMSLFGSMFTTILGRGGGDGAMSTSRVLEMAGAGGRFLVLALVFWIIALLWSLNPPKKNKGTTKSTTSPADPITRDTEL